MKPFQYFLLPAICSILLLSSCRKNITNSQPADPLIAHIDTSIRPQDNFFFYANGGWFKQNPIPPSESSNGIFNLVRDTINAQVKRICEHAAMDTQASKNSNKQKIGDFYASGMDSIGINKAGLSPLQSALDKIESITDPMSLLSTISYLHTIGVTPAFTFYVKQDDKNSARYALFFMQGGLGLEDRDYYFNDDSLTKVIRKEYINHLKAIYQLTGADSLTAQKNAESTMKLETSLAKASRTLEDLRDPIKNYNKFSIQAANQKTSNFSWDVILNGLKINNADSLIIGQPEFFVALNKLIKEYPVSEWKTYLKWQLIDTYAEYLNEEIEQQNFKFFYTVLNGISEQQPRWKRITRSTNSYLGELIGQVYVDEYIPENTKEKLVEIGENIRTVFAERLEKLDWMSPATKEKAKVKLQAMVMKVGYPDHWKDMSTLEIGRNSYCENVIRSQQWFYDDMIKRFGQPVDRMEWFIYPQTYNAYYSPSNNEIVIPACNIMVPGFEGRMPDDAVLYAIVGGSTFGHEIIHGFDDNGSMYDELGNLKNWWTEKDRKLFMEKTKLIVDQYNNYSVFNGLHLNGEATQGENIADLAGVILGHEAFMKTEQYKTQQMISGLTPNQRYFLSYAFAWMVNITNESLANQIMTDVHSPAQFRINGPLSNIPEFYQTFNIVNGDAMYRPDSLRVEIW